MPRQTHSQRVAIINDNNSSILNLEGFDALVTSLPGTVIGINTADCVPIVLVDPVARIIGAAHAGWKGTKMRIASSTVEAMIELGANANNIFAAFGPSICQQCFEVGDEVVAQFAEAGFNTGAITMRNHITGKAHIDLIRANCMALAESGINPSRIAPSQGCTRCNHQRYFSARRLGINSGRIFTGIMLNK
jgi:YfiH family protein